LSDQQISAKAMAVMVDLVYNILEKVAEETTCVCHRIFSALLLTFFVSSHEKTLMSGAILRP
jgi:hypothetical protein